MHKTAVVSIKPMIMIVIESPLVMCALNFYFYFVFLLLCVFVCLFLGSNGQQTAK